LTTGSRLLLLLLIALALSACKSREQADRASLDAALAARIQAIPAADPAKYRALRESRAWRNPYLIVKPNGVALLDVDNSLERYINPDDLVRELSQLPPSAWPYGRVVAVTESGIVGSEEDKARIRKNRAIVAGTLESLHVAINWIPSA
jgi:hypothetical protein